VNPPSVLLDHSFLAAVADPDDEHHGEAVSTYQALIDDFVAERHLLVARADHLRAVAKPELFAPIDKLHPARQHRNAAADLVTRTGVGLDEAITLVLIHRYRIRTVASFDESLARYGVKFFSLAPANDVVSNTTDVSPAATSSFGPN
jgi:predicted nucleic acid-binding protein